MRLERKRNESGKKRITGSVCGEAFVDVVKALPRYFTDEKRDEANTGISGSLDKESDKLASVGGPASEVFTGQSGLSSLPHHCMRPVQS